MGFELTKVEQCQEQTTNFLSKCNQAHQEGIIDFDQLEHEGKQCLERIGELRGSINTHRFKELSSEGAGHVEALQWCDTASMTVRSSVESLQRRKVEKQVNHLIDQARQFEATGDHKNARKIYQNAAQVFAHWAMENPAILSSIEPQISALLKDGKIERSWLRPPNVPDYLFDHEKYKAISDQMDDITAKWRLVKPSTMHYVRIDQETYNNIRKEFEDFYTPDQTTAYLEEHGVFETDIQTYKDLEAKWLEFSTNKGIVINKFLSDYEGDGLIVGRGKTLNDAIMNQYGNRENFDGYYSTEISVEMQPDLVIDMSNPRLLQYLPSNRFKDIFFEHIPPHTINRGTIPELYRSLAPGGTLRFNTDRGNDFRYGDRSDFKDQQELRQFLESVGFEDVQVTNSHERSGSREVNFYGIIEAKKPTMDRKSQPVPTSL